MSEQVKDGGPAFPSHGSMGEVTHEGATLRDYFAAKANVDEQLKGMTGNEARSMDLPHPYHARAIDWIVWRARMKAKLKFIEADAMLAAREAKS